MPLDAACRKLCRCEPVQARVRSESVVVGPPFIDDPLGLQQAGEEVPVEALVAQAELIENNADPDAAADSAAAAIAA